MRESGQAKPKAERKVLSARSYLSLSVVAVASGHDQSEVSIPGYQSAPSAYIIVRSLGHCLSTVVNHILFPRLRFRFIYLSEKRIATVLVAEGGALARAHSPRLCLAVRPQPWMDRTCADGWAHTDERACTVAERHERDTRVATRRHTLPREIRVRGTQESSRGGTTVRSVARFPPFLSSIDVERTCERRVGGGGGGSNERLRFLLSTRVDLEQRPRRRRRRRSTTTTV